MCTKIYLCWDISGSLVIKTLHLHCRDTGSIPSQRIKISYATSEQAFSDCFRFQNERTVRTYLVWLDSNIGPAGSDANVGTV